MDFDKDNIPESGNDREPVFYYSRERRLNRASAAVRSMNETGGHEKPGIIRSLFATKGNAVLFGCVLTLCIVFIFLGRAGKDRGIVLEGNTLSFAVLYEEGIEILRITKRAAQNGEAYLGPVNLKIIPDADSAGIAEGQDNYFLEFNHRIFFNPRETETFMLSLPFKDADYFVVLNSGSEQRVALVKKPK